MFTHLWKKSINFVFIPNKSWCCGNKMNGLCRIISNGVTGSVLLVFSNTPSVVQHDIMCIVLHLQSNKELSKWNKMHFPQLCFRFNVRPIDQFWILCSYTLNPPIPQILNFVVSWLTPHNKLQDNQHFCIFISLIFGLESSMCQLRLPPLFAVEGK